MANSNIQPNTESRALRQSRTWNTTLSWTMDGTHTLLMIGHSLLVLVWAPATSDLGILVISPYGTYQKSGVNGVVKFGGTANDEDYQITRDGYNMTITTSSNTSFKIFT